MVRTTRTALLLLLAGALTSPAAHGSGLGRPTPMGARAYGMGGALVAVVDDPSALYYNPAGLTQQLDDVALGGMTLVFSPRSFTPITDLDGEGQARKSAAAPDVVPLVGFSTRLRQRGVPSRLAVGFAFYNSNGGGGTWDKLGTTEAEIDAISTTLLELVPGVAYEINDVLSVGVGLRLGIGSFSSEMTRRPNDVSFSTSGLGTGALFGVSVQPTSALRLGATYRTEMSIDVSGDGVVDLGGATGEKDAKVTSTQTWPQSASLGVGYRPLPTLLLSGQLDWFDWSELDTLVVNVAVLDPTIEEMDFSDTLAGHLGAELQLGTSLWLRGGYTYDQNAIPGRTMSKQYLSGPMQGFGLGAGYQLGRHWRLDAGAEYLFGATVSVDDNRSDYQAVNWVDRANLEPGEYKSSLISFDLNVQFRY